MTKVSVITIFYNSGRFIEDTIKSVLGQTIDDWELILVDDGSIDQSTEIAKGYAQKYPDKIHYLEHPGHVNKGKSASRNLGAKHARGEYLVFLDSDDVLLPEKCARQANILDVNPDAAMVYGPTLYWHQWEGNPQTHQRDFMGKLGVDPDAVYQPPHLMALYLGGGGFIPCTCGMMVRKSVLEKEGGWEEEFKNLYEDQVFLAKFALNHPVYVEGECGDKYRQHQEMSSEHAISRGEYLPGKPHNAQSIFFGWLSEYMTQKGISDAEIWKAFEKAAYPYQHPVMYGMKEKIQEISRHVGSLARNQKRALIAGESRFGEFERMEPFCRDFGYGRNGGPIDRYYIERFLSKQNGDIKGKVLEVKSNDYSKQFGGSRIEVSDIIDVDAENKAATIIADLTDAERIESDAYDCVILTQVLQLIYDARAALKTVHRILRPNGVLLLTVPGITQIAYKPLGKTWFWSYSEASVEKMLTDAFPRGAVKVELYGNVLAASGFLYGLGASELTKRELDHADSDYQVIIAARAVKGGA